VLDTSCTMGVGTYSTFLTAPASEAENIMERDGSGEWSSSRSDHSKAHCSLWQSLMPMMNSDPKELAAQLVR
jgi:hypothetical protein